MHSDAWVRAVHPDDQDFIVAELDRQLKSGDYVELPEYRIVTALGHTKWVLSKGVVVERNSDGVVTHYIGADFDITRQKETEAKVDRLLSDRTTILRESRHRIKNQIRAIDLHIARMMEQPSVSDGDLASIRLQLRSMRNINCALTGTAGSQGVDVSGLICSIIGDVRQLCDPKNTASLSSHLEPVQVPSSVALILAVGAQEALTNAFKYASHDGSPLRVWIELATDDGHVELLVGNRIPGAGDSSAANDSPRETGDGLVFLKEMVENEQGTFSAGSDRDSREWEVVVRVPIAGRHG